MDNKRGPYILCALTVYCWLLLSGCSFLIHESEFKTETDDKKWVKIANLRSYPKEVAQHDDDVLTLTTRYNVPVDSCFISMGPPIVPIIPLFFFCFGDHPGLGLEFVLENRSDDVSIDIQGIRLLKSGVAVPVNRADYCTVNDKYNFLCSSVQEVKALPPYPVALNKGIFRLRLSYRNIGKLEGLTLEFDGISSAGKQVNIPPLVLRTKNNLVYCPFFLSGHESCFR